VRVLEEEKKEKRQYTRQIIKCHDWRKNCRRDCIIFPKQEIPSFWKNNAQGKIKTEEHNFRKILQKKCTSRRILPEDMQSEDVHNLWQEEKCFPLAINYAECIIVNR
jgi:hypothetical protein